MAKRGEVRPWRVRFEWLDSGISGADSYVSEDRANHKRNELRRNAIRRGETIVIAHGHRDGEPTIETIDGQALADLQDA